MKLLYCGLRNGFTRQYFAKPLIIDKVNVHRGQGKTMNKTIVKINIKSRGLQFIKKITPPPHFLVSC